MTMYAVIKKYGYGSTVLAMLRYRIDAEDYIKDYIGERMIEKIPSDLLDCNKASTLTIENDCFIQPMEVKIGEKDDG